MWAASDSRASDDVAIPTANSAAMNAAAIPKAHHSLPTIRPDALLGACPWPCPMSAPPAGSLADKHIVACA
ncbi:hypothetical protein GCM10023148_26920 [Actinokineospora soli]